MKIFLILSFVIRSSFSCIIPILRIRLTLLSQNTLSFKMCDHCNAQGSHPHRSKLPGMAMNICCFAFRSAFGFSHRCFNALIALLAFAIW